MLVSMKKYFFINESLKLEVFIPGLFIILLLVIASFIFYQNRKSTPILYPPVVQEVQVEETGSRQLTPEPDQKEEQDLLSGTWKYMPGAKLKENGMEISPIGYVLMNQNGTVSQKNPSINLVGTYIKDISGDFTVSGTLDMQNTQSATMQLYGQLPIIADEFRIERESLQLNFQKEKVTVSLWNGKSQKASVTQSFLFTSITPIPFAITKKENQFTIIINETEVGKLSDPGIFAKGTLWFGFDAEKSPWVLQSLHVDKIDAGSFTIADNSTLKTPLHNENGIALIAQKKRSDFTIGVAGAVGPMVSDSEYASLSLDSSIFNGVTPENDMKMINLQPQRGLYTFEKADGLVHLATQNGLSIHGHALVFGEANPLWFEQLPVKTSEDKKQIETSMKEHITTVMNHYKDSVLSWDVVNEPLSDEDDETFRTHKWYQAMGKDYIVKAFIAARSSNPKARLFINEYGLEEDGDRWEDMFSLMKWLKAELSRNGVSNENIGVGFQSHVYERADRINPEVLRKHIRQLDSIGVVAQISEMDVYSDDQDRTQTDQYAGVFAMCFAEPNCKAFRGWILSDRYDVWKDDDGSIQYGEDGLFDKNMRPRPAYTKMVENIKN